MATQLNDWLTIDKVSGTGDATITLAASSYKELVDRTANIKVQGIGTNAILTVRQNAYNPIEELKQKYFWVEFEEAGGEIRGVKSSNDMYGLTNYYSKLQYSFDGETWHSPMAYSNGPEYIPMGENKIVYLKNDSGTLGGTNGNQVRTSMTFTARAKVGGKLSSLAYVRKFAFSSLFYTNKFLTDASELIFDETTKDYCYHYMFNGCTSLVNAPVLPATTLADSCYYSMFQGCTSLVNAPVLPATTLANNCYCYMFADCTSLVNAPILPATKLANYCYENMFLRCTSLVNAPALPATELKGECYRFMFRNCTSLVNAPTLPATTLGVDCYRYMFEGCTSLRTAPTLPATRLLSDCYYGMFRGCSNLNYIKMLATDMTETNCLTNWVDGVSPTGTFIKHPDFDLPTGTSGIPQGWIINDAELPITPNPDTPNPDTPNPDTPSNDYFWVKFEETNGKVSITDAKVSYSFDGNTWTNNVASISMGDNTIVYLQGLNNTTTNKAKIQFTKKAKVGGDLSSLKEIGDSAFKYLFLNNTYLTDASALILPWTTLANGCYYSMFKGCTSLVAAPTLPATTLAKDCYYNMFYGCIRLVSAPTLPATTLAVYCYGRMFAGCTNLNYIKMLATDISADSCLASWVDGVASTGTFIKHPDANLSSGVSGIPSNWTVENATE